MSKAKRKSNIFQDELLEGEEILWMDKPQAWKLLNVYDLYLIPVSVFWCAIVFSFWQTSGFFVFILPHTLIGLYMLFGRFIVKYLRNRRTYYAITDRRILIMTGLLARKFQTFAIDTLPALDKSIGFGGIGTISFGIEPTRPWWTRRQANYANTGMEFFGYSVTAFYDIANANEVYRLISELQHRYSAIPVQSYENGYEDAWQPAKRKAFRWS